MRLVRPGFSLIEIMITVVISAVLISGGLAAYRGMANKQNVKQAGSMFQTNLKLFQQKALASEKPIICSGPLSAYKVIYLNSTTYQVKAVCGGSQVNAQNAVLTGGTQFSQAFSPITFPVLSAAISGAQTISITKDNYTYQIVLEAGGVIRGGLQ